MPEKRTIGQFQSELEAQMAFFALIYLVEKPGYVLSIESVLGGTKPSKWPLMPANDHYGKYALCPIEAAKLFRNSRMVVKYGFDLQGHTTYELNYSTRIGNALLLCEISSFYGHFLLVVSEEIDECMEEVALQMSEEIVTCLLATTTG